MKLRPYQLDAINTIWASLGKSNRVLCVLPTGAGKTVIFKELLSRAHVLRGNDMRSVVLLNRETLVRQTARTIGEDVGIFCAALGEKDTTKPITVASIQSINKEELEGIKLCIIDEAHNLSETYEKFLANLGPNCKLVGFTATPFSPNGLIYGPKAFWPMVHFKRSLKYMIDGGFLVRPILSQGRHQFDTSKLSTRMGEFRLEEIEELTSDEKKVKQQIADAMPRLSNRNRIIWACSSIKHAELLKKFIPESVSIMHSKQNAAEKEINQVAFENGFCRHMISVTMLAEGYDFPAVDAIVLMRPTRSARLYIQIVGRGLRLFDGKKDCLVLDYGEVVQNLGPLDNPLVVGKSGVKKEPLEVTLKACPKCLSYIDKMASSCPDCSYEFSTQEMATVSKNITRVVSGGKLLSDDQAPEERHLIKSVEIKHHVAKSSGTKCVRIDFHTVTSLWPISKYVGAWPQSWLEGKKMLHEMGLPFSSFQEAWEAIEQGWTQVDIKPVAVITKKVGKYSNVVRLEIGSPNRERNIDIPSKD